MTVGYPFKRRTTISITKAFQKFLYEFNRKPKKIWAVNFTIDQ